MPTPNCRNKLSGLLPENPSLQTELGKKLDQCRASTIRGIIQMLEEKNEFSVLQIVKIRSNK
jgi:hypothetical protein